MAIAIDMAQFNQLSSEEKIKFIKQNAPHLITLLKKNISQLSPTELSQLFDVSQLELAAKEASEKFTVYLKKYVDDFSSQIEPAIKESELSPEEQALLKNTFTKPLIFAVSKAAIELNSVKEGKGFLYTTILSEKTITVLEAILSFKKSIDKIFPGISDKFLSFALTGLLTACSPTVALILKSSGIIDKVTDFLSTESLDKTINNMYKSLDKVREDKELKGILKIVEIASEVAEKINAEPEIMGKFNLTLEGAKLMAKEVSENPSSKQFLEAVVKYADTHIPSSSLEVEAKMQGVKEATLKILKEKDVPPEIIEKVEKIVDSSIQLAKNEMEKCFGNKVKIVDKVGHVLNAANTLSNIGGQITALSKNDPDLSNILKECTTALKNEVAKNIRGDVSKIASTMKNVDKKSELAKKVMGNSAANEVLMTSPPKTTGRAI